MDWPRRIKDFPAFQLALLGLTMAVIGTYIKAYRPNSSSLIHALGDLLILILLAGALLGGLAAILVAVIASQGKHPSERIATSAFVIIGILLVHALSELERDQYLLTIVPVFAGVLTAWGIAAEYARKREAT